MRARLIAAFVGLTVLVATLYGIPRAYVVADLVRSQEQSRVDRTADVLALLVDERLRAGGQVTGDYLDTLAAPGEHVTFRDPQGAEAAGGDPPDDDGAVVAVRTVAGGSEVAVERTASVVGDEITRALAWLAALGVLLAAFAALAGLWLARRLSQPFRELAVVARGLGEGRLHPDVPTYDVPEAQAIGRALADAGARLDELLEHEREVAVHTSHRLRTPVTALRLELEDLAAWDRPAPEVRSELARCVAELDRLEHAIGELLSRADERRAAREVDVDLDDLVGRTVLGVGHPAVVYTPAGPTPAHVDVHAVRQVVELLVADALAAGADRVEVGVASHRGHHEVVLECAEGPAIRPPAPDASWARIHDLAAAAGIRVARHATTRVLRVPRGPVPPASAAPQ